MTINSNNLLESLQADVRQIILAAEKLQTLDAALLGRQPAPTSWSVGQVVQHLNFYCGHYLSAIEERLHRTEATHNTIFRSGWLGNYFTKLMQPEPNGRIKKKMQSPKNAQPQAQPNAAEELQAFLQHQHQLLNLLQLAHHVDLEAVRIPTSLSSLISLKLGDTFRFVIVHEQRHFLQIETVLKLLGNNKAHSGKKDVLVTSVA